MAPSTASHRGLARHQRRRRSLGAPGAGEEARAIRTANDVPFATTGIHGLSQLNVWWLRLGIQHQRILPGTIRLKKVADGIWSIHFCRVLLGRVDERDYIIRT